MSSLREGRRRYHEAEVTRLELELSDYECSTVRNITAFDEEISANPTAEGIKAKRKSLLIDSQQELDRKLQAIEDKKNVIVSAQRIS